MGSSCTFPRPKRKITRNEHGTNNEEFDETNQPLVENQQNQQQRNEPKIFTYAQMVAATNEFDDDNILGEGGFGRVYKGNLQENDQVVAVKKMEGQEREEFNIEVGTLSAADHPNMVKLIGYCSEGRERLLVYEYMPLGSLSDLLHGVRANSAQLDWNARMKIAAGTAGGLAYLHYEMDPPIIYRDLKSSNILLDEGFNVKLSDFGLARGGPTEDESHVSTRVMGTYGYCAPEYAMTGQLTFKSDMYSLGVVLLELMTGRKAIDDTKPASEQNLVVWARPMLSNRKLFFKMVDPKLNGEYPIRGLEQALALVALCLQTRQNLRPSAADVCAALNCLATEHYGPQNQQV